jgi:hypothetical protein
MNSSNTQCLIPLKCLEILYPSSTETNEHTNSSTKSIISKQPTKKKTKKKTKKIIWMMGDPGEPVVFNRPY